MSKTQRVSMTLGLIGMVMAWTMLVADPATSQDRPQKKVPDAKRDLEQTTFMRKKLEASSQILEGLTSEDAKLIIKGAKALVEMSAAEKWQVQNNVMYRQFSGEFQRSAKSLLEAAEKENYDTAALKWIDATMKCLECHKFVRGTRLAEGKN
ncbi:MAG: hypothetical protein H7062_15320 [Candidatus Saccharimonas sp.]|nr:hypothetical protein [Planctomycetaceae bacterium]